MRHRSLSIGLCLAAAVVVVASIVTVVGAGLNVSLRPLDGVEGDLLFEASRIRAGLALYTDPVRGALDYGAIPARYYVLYPPVWAGFLSLLPPLFAKAMGRIVASFSFWGVLAWLALSARRACRWPAILAALYVGGFYSLAEFAGSARPDAAAVALSAVALRRAMRNGELDACAGALFALAAWTKPNVLGIGVGATVACVLVAPRSASRAFVGALAVSAPIVAMLTWVSGGSWFEHLVAATGQPLHARLFVHHLEARAQFFLALLALAGLWAFVARKDKGAALGLGALIVGVAWAFVTFAKVGSAANYWMEPCMAAVVVLSTVPPPPLSPAARSLLAIAVPFQVLWGAVSSVRASLESLEANRAHMVLLEQARSVCGIGPGRLVVGDEPGIEVELDGRLVAHAFPLTSQARMGRYPLAPWTADLARDEIGCVVTAHDRIERPPSDVDDDYDYFALPVRRALSARFEPAGASLGWEIYRRRAPNPLPNAP